MLYIFNHNIWHNQGIPATKGGGLKHRQMHSRQVRRIKRNLLNAMFRNRLIVWQPHGSLIKQSKRDTADEQVGKGQQVKTQKQAKKKAGMAQVQMAGK